MLPRGRRAPDVTARCCCCCCGDGGRRRARAPWSGIVTPSRTATTSPATVPPVMRATRRLVRTGWLYCFRSGEYTARMPPRLGPLSEWRRGGARPAATCEPCCRWTVADAGLGLPVALRPPSLPWSPEVAGELLATSVGGGWDRRLALALAGRRLVVRTTGCLGLCACSGLPAVSKYAACRASRSASKRGRADAGLRRRGAGTGAAAARASAAADDARCLACSANAACASAARAAASAAAACSTATAARRRSSSSRATCRACLAFSASSCSRSASSDAAALLSNKVPSWL